MTLLLRMLFAAAVLTIGLDQYRPVLGGAGNLSDVLSYAVFILGTAFWIARLDHRRLGSVLDRALKLEPLIWAGILLTLGGAIASLGSGAPAASWVVTFKYFATFCVWLPWVTVAVEEYLSVETAWAMYVVSFCGIAVLALSDILIGTRFALHLVSTPVYEIDLQSLAPGMRYGGPTGHPGSLGYMATIGFILCLSAAAAQKTWVRSSAWLVGLLACGSALLVSGSRAAFLGVIVGCFILFALSGPGGRKRVLTISVAGLCVLWIGLRATGLASTEVDPVWRLVESLQPRRGFEADWQRGRDLQLTQRLLSADPLTGYGMEDIGTFTGPTKVAFNLPHFILLQSWIAGGILALWGTLWLYGVTLWLGWRAVREARPMALGLFATCASLMLMDMVNPGLYQRFKLFAVALLIATLHRSNRIVEPSGSTPVVA